MLWQDDLDEARGLSGVRVHVRPLRQSACRQSLNPPPGVPGSMVPDLTEHHQIVTGPCPVNKQKISNNQTTVTTRRSV